MNFSASHVLGKRGLAAGPVNISIQLGNAWRLGVAAVVVAASTGALGGGAAGPEVLVGGRWLGS